MTSLYKTPVSSLNGIGEKRAALFCKTRNKKRWRFDKFLSSNIRGLEQYQAYQ